MIILLAAGFDTAQGFCGGDLTKIFASARWTKWNTARANRSRFCGANAAVRKALA